MVGDLARHGKLKLIGRIYKTDKEKAAFVRYGFKNKKPNIMKWLIPPRYGVLMMNRLIAILASLALIAPAWASNEVTSESSAKKIAATDKSTKFAKNEAAKPAPKKSASVEDEDPSCD